MKHHRPTRIKKKNAWINNLTERKITIFFIPVYFSALNISLPGQMQFLFFSSFAVKFIMLKRKADEKRPSAFWRKIQKLMQQTPREEYMDKYWGIVKSSLSYGVRYAALTSLSVILACMILVMCVLFTHLNISITLKVQVLYLKSDFVALISSWGLAAMIKVIVLRLSYASTPSLITFYWKGALVSET